MTPALVAMLAYLALQLGIGVWISRRIRTESDYLLAGRNLGYTLATFSIFATWFGSETIMGSAGRMVALMLQLPARPRAPSQPRRVSCALRRLILGPCSDGRISPSR